MAENEGGFDGLFVIGVHNRPGALAKIASAFHRRAMNIQCLTVAPSEQPEISTMTIRIAAPRTELERVAAAIDNLVDVLSVELRSDPSPVSISANGGG